ncbi:MAG: hypothetical protein R2734_16620 [Nocardioides sp.]
MLQTFVDGRRCTPPTTPERRRAAAADRAGRVAGCRHDAPRHHDRPDVRAFDVRAPDLVVLAGGAVAVALAALTRFLDAGAVVPFVCSALAVTLLARSWAARSSSWATASGPAPRGAPVGPRQPPRAVHRPLALKAGLVAVVQAALIGSILANLLLVLGLAFVVGGLRHRTQQLGSERVRSLIVLMVLSVIAMVIPPSLPSCTRRRRRTRRPCRCWWRSC